MPAVTLTFCRFCDADRGRWLAHAEAVLSPAEHQHAASMPDAGARAQHAIGRAMMRLIGSWATGCAPELIGIELAEGGKPFFTDVPGLHLSIAHAGSVVVVASAEGAAVGVDVEEVAEPDRNPILVDQQRHLAQRRFSPSEHEWLAELSDAEFCVWFARVWTAKEAIGKALGVGMVPALSGAVLARQDDHLVLTEMWQPPAATDWTLHQLTAPGGREPVTVALPTAGSRLGRVTHLTPEAFAGASRRGEGPAGTPERIRRPAPD